MKVNFNNLRKQAIYSYHRLCTTLNKAIQDKSHDPTIVLDPGSIQKDMDDLRMHLWAICLAYQEGDEDFRDLMEKIDAGGEIANFNPETED